MGAQVFVPRSLEPVAPAVGLTPRSRSAEASSLLLFASALFLFVALATLIYDPADPGVHGADWMGSVGAALAGLLVQAFGAASWLLPVDLVVTGLPLFRGRAPEQLGLRVSGDLVILILVSALLQVLWPTGIVFGAGLPGGNVGLFFGELMRGLFSAPGSLLVGFTGIALILIGRASFSFIVLCERALLAWHRLCAFSSVMAERLLGAWRKARALRLEQAALQEAELRIEPASNDALIFRELSDESPWVPHEMTGCPPLAIVESLRRGVAADAHLDDSRFEGGDVFGAELDKFSSSFVPNSADLDAEDGLWAGLAADSELAPDVVESSSAPAESSPAPAESSELPPKAGRRADAGKDSDDPAEAVRIVDTKKIQETRPARLPARRALGDYELPSTELLEPKGTSEKSVSRELLLRHKEKLEKTLLDYGVVGQVDEIHPGPTVTTFEFSPSAGTKVSKVAGLADDLALGLSRKVRIIAPIPGKNRIGFELPNDERTAVNLRELIEDERFQALTKKVPLPVVLGRDIVGAPFYADLSAMPHVIVAGATGAGKSVGLNVMLSSLLFSRSPEELRLLMIDPKVVELAPFDRIPHLLLPVVTDMKQAAVALRWAVDEMERRYQLFADAGTKNISTYNRYVERVLSGELPAPRPTSVDAIGPNGEVIDIPAQGKAEDGKNMPEKMPFIVIVVDEFADLMMQQGKEVEASVARLAQKARAAGMHVILATQRPSVDVITGMIKANFPTRIAFRVAQKVDSRTILDEQGAEVLLGRGDMLVKLNGANDTLRVQCPFVSEEEVDALTHHVRAQGAPRYQEAILLEPDAEPADEAEEKGDSRFEEAVLIVRESQRCSTSWLQRKMTIGYNRAAKIVETMERRGYVGPANGSKDREVFLPPG